LKDFFHIFNGIVSIAGFYTLWYTHQYMAIKVGGGDKIALVVIGAFLLLVIFAILSPSSSGKKNNTSVTSKAQNNIQSPIAEMTIDSAYGEFSANKLAFAQKYNGKLISISGKVSNIDSAIRSEYVIVSGDDDFSMRAQCFMSEKGKLLNYKKGDQITVQGYPRDSVVSELTLEKCSIK